MVAQNKVHAAFSSISIDAQRMNKTLARICSLGTRALAWQQRQQFARQMNRINHAVAACFTRMSGDTANRDHGPIRRECLPADAPDCTAIDSVGNRRTQLIQIQMVHATPNFLVRRNTNPHPSMRQPGLRQQPRNQGDQNCHASFVVRPQQRFTAGSHHILAHRRQQICIARISRIDHLLRIIGQAQCTALIVSVNDRLHISTAKIRRCVCVRQQRHNRHRFTTDRGRHIRNHISVRGQVHLCANFF